MNVLTPNNNQGLGIGSCRNLLLGTTAKNVTYLGQIISIITKYIMVLCRN